VRAFSVLRRTARRILGRPMIVDKDRINAGLARTKLRFYAYDPQTNLPIRTLTWAMPPVVLIQPNTSAALADVVASMAQAASIDRSLAPVAGLGQMGIEGDVRGDRARAQVTDEAFDVEPFIPQ
jgi:hypothetical protein